MGIFRREKGPYEDIPDEKLNWNQQQQKKWQSDAPFYVDSGGYFSRNARECIDGCLHQTLGLHDIDALFQMKAPRFYKVYNDTGQNIMTLCDYIYKHLPNIETGIQNNNQYQELQGRYEELKKRCKRQNAIINLLMERNEELQNRLLEKNKEKESSPSLSR
ncbi:MAG: hypothetical protein ACTTH3_04565 [Schwartzia sp. (in: firmicutes)]